MTEFSILDAQHVDNGLMTHVKLKHHIPYIFGFHVAHLLMIYNFLLATPRAKL